MGRGGEEGKGGEERGGSRVLLVTRDPMQEILQNIAGKGCVCEKGIFILLRVPSKVL